MFPFRKCELKSKVPGVDTFSCFTKFVLFVWFCGMASLTFEGHGHWVSFAFEVDNSSRLKDKFEELEEEEAMNEFDWSVAFKGNSKLFAGDNFSVFKTKASPALEENWVVDELDNSSRVKDMFEEFDDKEEAPTELVGDKLTDLDGDELNDDGDALCLELDSEETLFG